MDDDEVKRVGGDIVVKVVMMMNSGDRGGGTSRRLSEVLGDGGRGGFGFSMVGVWEGLSEQKDVGTAAKGGRSGT